jgi:hypothetical protein
MKRSILVVSALLALGAAGAVVFGVAHARSDDRRAEDAVREVAIAAAADSLKVSVTQAVDGGTWSAGKFSTELGEPCYEIRAPAGWRAVGCARAPGPINYMVGGTEATTYVYGGVTAQVGDLRLVLDNCATQPVPVKDGVFLFVLPSALTERGVAPYKLVALTKSGAVLQELALGGTHAGTSSGC